MAIVLHVLGVNEQVLIVTHRLKQRSSADVALQSTSLLLHQHQVHSASRYPVFLEIDVRCHV